MIRSIAAAVLAAGLIAAPLAQNAAAQTKTETRSATAAKPKTSKPLTPGQQAARDRQKRCGEEWKAAKTAGKVETGMKWPQYWSACNKRLKSGA